jgi:hypothetical protein
MESHGVFVPVCGCIFSAIGLFGPPQDCLSRRYVVHEEAVPGNRTRNHLILEPFETWLSRCKHHQKRRYGIAD